MHNYDGIPLTVI